MIHTLSVGDIVDCSGVPFVITRVYKGGAITATPVHVIKDGRIPLEMYSYKELIEAAASLKVQEVNESNIVIGDYFDSFSDAAHEAEIDAIINTVE